MLKDKATLESVIESIENGSAEIESNKELVPKSSTENSEEANNQQSVEVSPEEFLARKKAMEEKIKQRRIEIEGLFPYLLFVLLIIYVTHRKGKRT